MTNISFEDLPQDVLVCINAVCNEFEQGWSSDAAPAIESLLTRIADRYQPVLAAELIALDAELRHAAGEHVTAANYADRFPQIDAAVLSVIVTSSLTDAPPNMSVDPESVSFLRHADSGLQEAESGKHHVSLSGIRRRLLAAAICTDSEVTQLVDSASQNGTLDEPTLVVKALRDECRITEYQADVLSGRTHGVLSLGDYTLLEQLGAGGMGTVFKAVHRRMHRTVALKVLRSDYQHNRRFRERFEREVFAAARLTHPNIVTAFDAGECGGIPYLVTEYIAAHDLGRIVRESGPLSVNQAISVLRQTALALEYAHQQGVIHRDVKPGNLLLDHTGTVKVLDVGLSRLVQDSASHMDDRPDISNTGFVMGTAEYMAPEQALDSRSADERSDIYSLGCTLFSLLNGKPCYPAESPIARILAHRDEPVPSLTTLRSDVPQWLDQVFERMVAKAPEDRFASMTDVLRAIPISEESETAPDGARREVRSIAPSTRRGVMIGAVSLAGLLTVVYLSGGFDRTGSDSETPSDDDAVVAGNEGTGAEDIGSGAPENRPAPAVAPFSESEAIAHQKAWADHLGLDVTFVDKWTGIEFVLIPPGRFTMGSTDEEVIQVLTSEVINDPMKRCSFRSEAPAREVEIERPFYMARTETTYDQFRQFIDQSGYVTLAEQENIGYGFRNGYFEQAKAGEQKYFWDYYGEIARLPDHPVANLTWVDATEYCRHYNKVASGLFYRLPYEREWEYACRAGTDSPWSCGDEVERLRWFAVYFERDRSGHVPAEVVGSRKPNAFGLYDMHGNVAEWCLDIFEWRDHDLMLEAFSSEYANPDDRQRFGVVRGGSVNSEVATTRSAARQAENRYNCCQSFRVVLEIPEAAKDRTRTP